MEENTPGTTGNQFRESKSRFVSKMLRDDSGRWMKRRVKKPIEVASWSDQRKRQVPVPLHNLTLDAGSGVPEDAYDRLEDLIGDPRKPERWITDTADAIRSHRGKPNDVVTVYSAAPLGTDYLHPGDWVSLSKGFAAARAKAYPRWQLLTVGVPAREVVTRSNDLLRWTWNGKRPLRNNASNEDARRARATTR